MAHQWRGLSLVTISLASFECGGRAGDDVSPNHTVGDASAGGFGALSTSNVMGTGAGGVGPTSAGTTELTSTGGAAPNDGLTPLSADQLSAIQSKVCWGHITSMIGLSCWLPRPEGDEVCGTMLPATAEQISLVVTDANGALFLVNNTSSDCALGGGYYVDDVNDRLVLCPSTCATVATFAETVVAYASCNPSPPCIF